MFKTIIKNIGFSLLLISSLCCYSHPTSSSSYQRQMEPQLFVCWTMMFRNMWFLSQSTKERMMIDVWNILFDDGKRDGYFCTILCKLHIVKLEIKHIPLSLIGSLISYTIRSLLSTHPRRSTIWLKSLLISQRNQLFLDLLISHLNILKPWKIFWIPIWNQIYHQGWAFNPGIISGHPFC